MVKARTIKDWLIIIAALADDAAIALVILLALWLAGVPITWPIIVFIILFFGFFTFLMHRLVIPAYHRRRVTGREGMIGQEGTVIEPLDPQGLVRVTDEYWKAESLDGNLNMGDKVTIVSVKGLTLKVKRKT